MGAAWRFAWASEPGASHLRHGVVCQDHAEVVALPANGPPQALLAVAADGAGSAARSDEGARAACHAFLAFGALAMEWLGNQAEYLGTGNATDILCGMRADLAQLASDSGQGVGAFACTMLCALITDDAALFVQLGDGAIVYRTEGDPQWHLAIAPQRGEYANETVFVTRVDAERYLQAVHLRRRVVEFALMTDGVEHLAIRQAEGRPHAPFFEHVLRDLRACAEPGHAVAPGERLAAFLASDAVNRQTDDDKTLVLATRIAVTPRA